MDMMLRSDNKRKAARFSVDVDGYYFYSNSWHKCRIYDLNVEGAGLRLNQFFIRNDVIKLKIGEDGDFNIIDSIVANVNGPRIGVQFVNLDEFDKEFIQRTINNKLKQNGNMFVGK